MILNKKGKMALHALYVHLKQKTGCLTRHNNPWNISHDFLDGIHFTPVYDLEFEYD